MCALESDLSNETLAVIKGSWYKKKRPNKKVGKYVLHSLKKTAN